MKTDSGLRKLLVLSAGAGLVLLAGCGRPPSAGGPPGGDWPVQAVVALVKPEKLEEKIFLVGSLDSKESIDFISEVDAAVVEIGFEEGARVKKGQVLFRLDAVKLEAVVKEAESRFLLAEAELERNDQLYKSATISKQEYDRAASAFSSAQALLNLTREQLQDTVIKAPFDGVMGDRKVSLGQYVRAGDMLASLVQLDPLEVTFNVPERFVGEINLGQEIAIQTIAYPGERFPGKVSYIAPGLDESSRTIPVKAVLGNADGRLKPGMFGELNLVLTTREMALVVPESAVNFRGDQAAVFVVNGEDKAEIRMVQTGVRQAGRVEITEGLAAGDRIVVEGHQKMGPGSTVIISPKSRAYGVEPPVLGAKAQG